MENEQIFLKRVFVAILIFNQIEAGSLKPLECGTQGLQSQLKLRANEHEHLDKKLDTILDEIRKLEGKETKKSRERIEARIRDMFKTGDSLRDKNAASENVDSIRDNNVTAENDNFATVGTTYIRWGRSGCPENDSGLVYPGYAAGGYFVHRGAASSMLCLPNTPVWGKYDDSLNNYGGHLYGVEYEHLSDRARAVFGRSLHDQDAPCAVCEVRGRSSQIMIPGRTTCIDGWTMEYWGYLMTGHHAHAAQGDFYCVDADPESLPESRKNQNGYLLYLVEGRCGSLRCPPYVNGRELPCVVCTK